MCRENLPAAVVNPLFAGVRAVKELVYHTLLFNVSLDLQVWSQIGQ